MKNLVSNMTNLANRREAKVVLAVLVLVVTYFAQHFGGNWFHSMWFGIVRPSLVGNGPEDLIATAIIAAFIPQVRRWLKAHVHLPNAAVAAQLAALHEKLDGAHAKMDHIIKHSPHIPNQVPGVGDVTKPPEPSNGAT